MKKAAILGAAGAGGGGGGGGGEFLVELLVQRNANGNTGTTSIAPAAGGMLIATVCSAGPTDYTPGGTLTGTWTKIGEDTNGVSSREYAVYMCNDYGASGTVQFAPTGVVSWTQIGVYLVSGDDLDVTGVRQIKMFDGAGDGADGTNSVSFTTPPISSVFCWAESANASDPGNLTQLVDNGAFDVIFSGWAADPTDIDPVTWTSDGTSTGCLIEFGVPGGVLPNPSSRWDFSFAPSIFEDTGLSNPAEADDKIRSVNDLVGAADMVGTGDGTGILWKTNIQNGLAVARFTNAVGNDLLSSHTLANGFTVFVTAQFASVAQSRRTLFGGDAGDTMFGADFTNTSKLGLYDASDHASSATLDANWHVYTMVANGASSKMRIDSTGVYSGNPGSSGWDNPAIGNNGGGAAVMVGDIGEVVLYERVMDDAEMANTEAFLAAKWGI
jgi:hypothetical protein